MRTCVVMPCYRTKDTAAEVIKSIPIIVERIFAVDDGCPENTGKLLLSEVSDPRLKVLFHDRNKGVGGAVKTGYRAALEENYDIIIKIDSDGQMDTGCIPQFIEKIESGTAVYVKGNRFYFPENLIKMPKIRMIGNFGLSFFSKLVSGYWELMDPANGYTAISNPALKILPLDKIDDGYFFENDVLFRLGTFRAALDEVPVDSIYKNERSSMRIPRILVTFPFKYIARFIKRILYNYFLRDFNLGSIYILISTLFLLFGTGFGIYKWVVSYETNVPSTAGTVMIPAVLVIFGMQFLLSAINFDMNYKRRLVPKNNQDVRKAR